MVTRLATFGSTRHLAFSLLSRLYLLPFASLFTSRYFAFNLLVLPSITYNDIVIITDITGNDTLPLVVDNIETSNKQITWYPLRLHYGSLPCP